MSVFKWAPPAMAALLTALAVGSEALAETTQLGWLEHARIAPSGLKVDAKLDSGAKTSSIHAEILRGPSVASDLPEDENGDPVEVPDDEEPVETVVFRLTNEDGESTTLEREVVRYLSVKLRGDGVDKRPVVILDICLAGVKMTGEVNLTDRSKFNYPFLVGRTMLAKGDILIDPRKIYTVPATCEDAEPEADDDESTDR